MAKRNVRFVSKKVAIEAVAKHIRRSLRDDTVDLPGSGVFWVEGAVKAKGDSVTFVLYAEDEERDGTQLVDRRQFRVTIKEV